MARGIHVAATADLAAGLDEAGVCALYQRYSESQLVTEAVAATVALEDHGSTFGGGPLACAASLATLEAIRAERLIERAARLEAAFRAALAFGPVREVRGHGCLLGLVLDGPTAPVRERLLARGFVTGGAADPRVIRLTPPLTLGEQRPAELGAALRDVGD